MSKINKHFESCKKNPYECQKCIKHVNTIINRIDKHLSNLNNPEYWVELK